jgi:hypothetical protein
MVRSHSRRLVSNVFLHLVPTHQLVAQLRFYNTERRKGKEPGVRIQEPGGLQSIQVPDGEIGVISDHY